MNGFSIRGRRGSALVLAIWMIFVLSLLVMNFVVESKLQTGVNLYVRERTRVNRLVDSGRTLAEMILLKYSSVSDWSEDEDHEQLLEDDRWLEEKRDLKTSGSALIGPVPVDESNPLAGTVTIEIRPPRGGLSGQGADEPGQGWNINTLYAGDSTNGSKYREIWENILHRCHVPEDAWDELIDSWNDWRDSDGQITGDDGAEDEYYADELEDLPEEQRYKPRNGEIIDLKELAMVRGFRDHPAVLIGGDFYEEDDEEGKGRRHRKRRKKDDEAVVTSILPFFTVIGSGRINVNLATKELLMTIPGIVDEGEPDDDTVAQAILEAREYQLDESGSRVRSSEDYGPFKDWNDLTARTYESIGSDAQNYLEYDGTKQEYFEVVITGKSGGISHEVRAIVFLQNKKVRYVRWQEDP